MRKFSKKLQAYATNGNIKAYEFWEDQADQPDEKCHLVVLKAGQEWEGYGGQTRAFINVQDAINALMTDTIKSQ